MLNFLFVFKIKLLCLTNNHFLIWTLFLTPFLCFLTPTFPYNQHPPTTACCSHSTHTNSCLVVLIYWKLPGCTRTCQHFIHCSSGLLTDTPPPSLLHNPWYFLQLIHPYILNLALGVLSQKDLPVFILIMTFITHLFTCFHD